MINEYDLNFIIEQTNMCDCTQALEQIAMEFLQIDKNEFIAKLSGLEIYSNEIDIFVEIYRLNDMSCVPYSLEHCQIAIRPPKNAPQSTRTTNGGD